MQASISISNHFGRRYRLQHIGGFQHGVRDAVAFPTVDSAMSFLKRFDQALIIDFARGCMENESAHAARAESDGTLRRMAEMLVVGLIQVRSIPAITSKNTVDDPIPA